MKNSIVILISLALALITSSAFGLTPHETFVFQSTPSPEQIAEWSSLPGTRGFIIEMSAPTDEELRALLNLRGVDHLTIEVSVLPDSSTTATWKKLAERGTELVGLNVQLPTAEEIARLNEIGFSKVGFILDYVPTVEESRRLADLKAPVAITFAMNEYPRFLDKPNYLAFPESIPLAFAADYWPWYSHMDVMNMLPHRKLLRVQGIYPSDDHLPYLGNIRSLDAITVETDFDPGDLGIWKKMGEVPIRWISKDRVPERDALAAFESSASEKDTRKLVIDQDAPLTTDDRARLSRSRLLVEWTHLAPTSYLSSKRRHAR